MPKTAENSLNLRVTVYCSMFTALMIIGGFISIPIGPVPIALADFFVMTAGLFLGFKYGLMSTALFIALGILGMPVFAGGAAGLAVIAGPTGGYLLGYLLAAASIGLISGGKKISNIKNMLSLITGNILLYAAGVPWLKMVMGLSWKAALAAGLIPFLPGAAIKIAVALALGKMILPHFRENMSAASLIALNGEN